MSRGIYFDGTVRLCTLQAPLTLFLLLLNSCSQSRSIMTDIRLLNFVLKASVLKSGSFVLQYTFKSLLCCLLACLLACATCSLREQTCLLILSNASVNCGLSGREVHSSSALMTYMIKHNQVKPVQKTSQHFALHFTNTTEPSLETY